MTTAIMFTPARSLGSHWLWGGLVIRISVDVVGRGEFLPTMGATTTTTTTATTTHVTTADLIGGAA
jgi:hypothetical protein